MNHSLIINTIDSVLDLLEKGEEYDWWDQRYCNCGLFVRAMLGVAEDELNYAINKFTTPHLKKRSGVGNYLTVWDRSSLDKYVCPSTGLNMAFVFDQLDSAGVDLEELELLKNPIVLERLEKQGLHWVLDSQVFFEAYLKEWKSLLIEQQLQELLNTQTAPPLELVKQAQSCLN